MRLKKKMLSIILAFIFTFMIMLNNIAVQAAQKQTIVPNVGYVKAPTLEYTAGDIVTFDLHAPNYGGKVQYRVLLWDNNKKEARDLWTTGDRYYTNWMPYGNNTFNLHWRIDEPGSYRITVYVKRAGIANNNTYLKGYNCDSYMESQAFAVKAKATAFDRATAFDKDGQTYGSIDENKVEVYNNDIIITGKDVTFNNAKLEGNLTIIGNNAVIRNVNIAGNIVVDPGKEGICTLENVTAKEIKVLSGGQNSIHIKDSNIETMNVNSQSPVRIEVDGDTEIVSTSASGYVIFDRKNGTYGTITITKDENGESVIEFRGDIQDKIEVETAATIKTGQGSSIANLVINTKNYTDVVRLEGQYSNVEINSKAKLELAANTNIKNIVANNDAEINLDKTATITSIEKGDNEVVYIGEGAPLVSGGGNRHPRVAVSAITGIAGTAKIGVELTAGTVTPTGATVSYQWKISTDGVIYNNIVGATKGKYTPVAGDAGKYIKVSATGTGSYTGTVTSEATAAISAQTLPDTTVPVITLLGNAIENLANGAEYTDAGATALDNKDGDITSNIVTTITNNVDALGTFDNTKAATYTYHYNISDAAANAATEVTRTVVVAAPIAITIDSFESDNTYQTAKLIGTDGTTQSHTIYSAGDEDWVKFSAEAGKNYQISTSNLIDDPNNTQYEYGMDTYIELYDIEGTSLINSNNDNIDADSKIIWNCSTTGIYYVRIMHYSHSPYNVIGQDTGTGSYDISVTKLLTIAQQFPDESLAIGIEEWLGLTEDDIITKDVIAEYIANGNDELYLRYMGISNMTGFDIFNGTDLRVLSLTNNNLTGFDARGLTNLERLGLAENQLTSINVSGLTKLINLGLRNNPLTNVDVSGLTNLQNMNVTGTQLSTLDVNGLVKLKILYAYGTDLTTLDVSGLINLEELDVSSTKLSNLNANGLTNLYYLYANDTDLTTLDASGLINLVGLDVSNTQLSSLNVSGLTNLYYLYANDTDLTTLDVSSLTNLEELDVYNTKLSSLNVSGLVNLKYLYVLPLTNADIIGLEDLNLDDTDLEITAPFITLLGSATMNLTVGDTFTDPGVTASDNVDGDITANVTVAGDTVNTAAAGTYVITYNVSDSAGNEAEQVTRTVIVIADAAPTASVVSISGTAKVKETLTGSYTYADENGDLEGTSTFKWLANTGVAGAYEAITSATGTTYVVDAALVGKTIKFEVTPVAATGISNGTPVGSLETAAVAAAAQGVPSEILAGVAPTTLGGGDGKITGTTTAMEYKLSAATDYTAVTGMEITGLEAGDYDVRYAAKTGFDAGTDVVITVPEGDESAATITPSTPTPTQNIAFSLSITGAKDRDGTDLAGEINVKVTSSDTTEGISGIVYDATVNFTAGAGTVPVILQNTGAQTLMVVITGVTASKEANITVAAKAVTGISITKAPTKTSYVEDQTFDSAGMVVTATYNDSSNAEVTGYTCSPAAALKISDTTVTVTYEGKTATQAITVGDKTIPADSTSGITHQTAGAFGSKQVTLTITVKNASGGNITGLLATDFTVKINGATAVDFNNAPFSGFTDNADGTYTIVYTGKGDYTYYEFTNLTAKGAVIEAGPAGVSTPAAVSPILQSVTVSTDGTIITLAFDKAMVAPVYFANETFHVVVDGHARTFNTAVLNTATKIDLPLSGFPVIFQGITVTLSFDGGCVESTDLGFLQKFSNLPVTNNSTVAAALALDTLTLDQGTSSGTTQITAATTGVTFKYKVYTAGTAPTKLPSGATEAAAGVDIWTSFIPLDAGSDNIAVTTGQEMAVVAIDASGNVSQYTVHTVLAGEIKA